MKLMLLTWPLLPTRKLVPMIVTSVPTGPLDGEKLVIVGGASETVMAGDTTLDVVTEPVARTW